MSPLGHQRQEWLQFPLRAPAAALLQSGWLCCALSFCSPEEMNLFQCRCCCFDTCHGAGRKGGVDCGSCGAVFSNQQYQCQVVQTDLQDAQ